MKLLDLYNEIKINQPLKKYFEFHEEEEEYGKLFLLDKSNYPYKLLDGRAYYNSRGNISFNAYGNNNNINKFLKIGIKKNLRGKYEVPLNMVKIKK